MMNFWKIFKNNNDEARKLGDFLYFPNRKFRKQANYNDEKIYKEAGDDPVAFWEKTAGDLIWKKKWDSTFEHKPPFQKWFLGGKMNITETILEKHLGKNKTAVIWEPETSEEKGRILTYDDLYKEVNKFSNALLKAGVRKGDRVGIYLPMIPEIIIAMLACARIGAVHLVVFSAFSPEALKIRLQTVDARGLITADGYYRRGQLINLKQNADKGIEETQVEKTIVVKRAKNKINFDGKKDFWWHELVENESEKCEAKEMDSEDNFFILPESGTTGQFLPILHTIGGYAVYAYWTGKAVLDFHQKDVLWCTSDPGWITGHTYTIYSPLLNGATTVLFEGAPDWPNSNRWADIIDKYNVTIFYTAPTAIRMFIKYGKDVIKKNKFKHLKLLGSVGEPIDESTWLWYYNEVGKRKCPLVDTWWQTETGGIVISSLPGIGPFKPSFAGRSLPGVKIGIFDEEGKSCKIGEKGNLVILPPFVPGFLRNVYGSQKKYTETYWGRYWDGIYFTSDGALKDDNGLIRITGRVDDIIKVAGHRLSTGELEDCVARNHNVIEAAVFGAPDHIKGQVPIVFVVSRSKKTAEDLKKEIIETVRKEIGPTALPKQIYVVSDLPKTRSGKIMRHVLKRIFLEENLGDLTSLSNPESLEEIKNLVNGRKT
jgi:acetyl-CoA synthetase